MPWDCFCPECSAAVIGDMTEDDEEMNKQWDELAGQHIECESCGCIFVFDTDEIIKHGKKFRNK